MSYGEAAARKTIEAGRILVVEDEAIIAGHISTRLEKAGFTVAGIHSSSSEVLDNIPSVKPDLVLMDIRIKGPYDGIHAATQIRDRFDIPVIFLTAHTDQETVERAKVTGAFGFLTKPINHVSLQTSIEMALTRHRSEREVRRQHMARLRSRIDAPCRHGGRSGRKNPISESRGPPIDGPRGFAAHWASARRDIRV